MLAVTPHHLQHHQVDVDGLEEDRQVLNGQG